MTTPDPDSGARLRAATAEKTSLDDSSVDLLTASQAFHWFDIGAAREEFLRVLRPQGQVALIWNDRVRTDPLHVAMDEVFATYGGARRGAMLAHENRSDVPRFFGGAAVDEIDLPHRRLRRPSAQAPIDLREIAHGETRPHDYP